MPKYSYLFLCCSLFFCVHFFGQKKTLTTQFTTEKIVVDGNFDEQVWKNADIATNFVMENPESGKAVPQKRRTEVKIVYDNDAIYIAAKLFDNFPEKILKELTSRDDFATADHFGVFLNGYNDGQQEFRFFTSAAGVQQDCVYTEANDEDFSWDAIWESSVKITSDGWTVEMKIPYAALRFSSEDKQTWGLNFYREIRRDRHQYTWSLISNQIPNESTQAGILEGLEHLKTPTRLFLIPYASQYLYANKKNKANGEFKGGLDIKYGINDAFTLDAILIPDFGQTKFDNVELNLSAFEQRFDENRPFFTEGTDLFNKGDLLYSRRIGEVNGNVDLANNETIVDIPTSIKLINAFKISGRTKGGLGIGVLNAVTEKTSVEIKNNDTGETRLETFSPLTNYNVFVLDQRFRKNSSISLINTNVTRDGHFRDANASALVWDLNTKKNTYNFNGNLKYSYINEYKDLDDRKGYTAGAFFGKSSGKYRYGIGGSYYSREYDNNDLGINYQTHYHSIYASTSYRILQPNNTFNSFQIFHKWYTEYDNRTGRLQAGSIILNFNTTDLNNDYYGFGTNSRPLVTYDFYEPRSTNEKRFVAIPKNLGGYFYFSSNYNRKFALDFNPFYTFINEKERREYGFMISPRYRFNDHFSLIYYFNFFRQNNNTGYIDNVNDDIVFAQRDRITYTNTLQTKYSINSKMNLLLNIRHYWSYTKNKVFLTLLDNGDLKDNFTYTGNDGSNLNIWNLDLSYVWWFAPGSQVSILYRNSSSIFNQDFSHQFEHNIKDAFDNQNLNHVFSISIRYFIDYNSLKKSKTIN